MQKENPNQISIYIRNDDYDNFIDITSKNNINFDSTIPQSINENNFDNNNLDLSLKKIIIGYWSLVTPLSKFAKTYLNLGEQPKKDEDYFKKWL